MLFTKDFTCNLDWDSVARAFYRMYPSRYYPHVGDVHIIDHEVLPKSKQVSVRRIARVRYNLPSIVLVIWSSRDDVQSYMATVEVFNLNSTDYIVGPKIEYMLLEESLLDLDRQTISIKTTGFTMTDSYRYDEEASFKSSGKGITHYQSAIDFKILGFGFFNSTLEAVVHRVVSEFSKECCVKKAIVEAGMKLD